MAGFDSGATLAERMRAHAADSTHLYGELMRALADDWDAGGPVRSICRGWEESPQGTVLQLRLLAGLFRIVLTGRAPQLVPYYPCLGGTAPPSQAWPQVREVLVDNVDELHDALAIAPQTNEVGRSGALLLGLFESVRRSGRRRVRLLEVGASAGLNLLVDRFRFEQAAWSFGPADSPLVFRDMFIGDVEPEEFEIVERRGCDLHPVDITTDEGRLRLRSFVWPFQPERHERLMSALEVAAQCPVEVDPFPAGEWLEDQLARGTDGDVLTVVWHSVTRMYWPPEETRRVDATVAAAARRGPVAHVAMEHAPDVMSGADLTLSGIGSDGRPSFVEQTLATVADHGIPVTVHA
ncbi:MAG TPA: DUF2332 domain-containing protein [Nocardioidaceae bacterium]